MDRYLIISGRCISYFPCLFEAFTSKGSWVCKGTIVNLFFRRGVSGEDSIEVGCGNSKPGVGFEGSNNWSQNISSTSARSVSLVKFCDMSVQGIVETVNSVAVELHGDAEELVFSPVVDPEADISFDVDVSTCSELLGFCWEMESGLCWRVWDPPEENEPPPIHLDISLMIGVKNVKISIRLKILLFPQITMLFTFLL